MLVRYPEHSGCEEHRRMLEELPPGGLDPVLDSLNQLGSVAWRRWLGLGLWILNEKPMNTFAFSRSGLFLIPGVCLGSWSGVPGSLWSHGILMECIIGDCMQFIRVFR